MSLLRKKREEEKMRQNGLNDPVQHSQQQSFNSWSTPVSMQPKMTFSNAPIQSFSMNPLHASMIQSHGQEHEDLMKSCMQQAGMTVSVKGQKKMTSVPGWTVPGNPNPGEPVIDIGNLPPGSYYDDQAVYIDPATGKEISAAEIQQLQEPTELGNTPKVNITLQSQCIDPNCSNCCSKK